MGIDIEDEWFGIVNGTLNRVMTISRRQNLIAIQYLENKSMDLIKFCINIDIDIVLVGIERVKFH